MKFDIDKYKKRRFHKDNDIDKKIKALFIMFDIRVAREKLSLRKQLDIIDEWIEKFEKVELYEVIPIFKLRRGVIVRSIIKQKNDEMPLPALAISRLKHSWTKVIDFVMNRFERKDKK